MLVDWTESDGVGTVKRLVEPQGLKLELLKLFVAVSVSVFVFVR